MKQIKFIPLILIFITLVCTIAVIFIENYFQWRFLFNGADRVVIVFVAVFLVLIFVAAWFFIFFKTLVKKIIFTTLLILLAWFAIFPVLGMYAFSEAGQRHHFFSPCGETELIFDEWSFRVYRLRAYVRENAFFVRPLEFSFSAIDLPEEKPYWGLISDGRFELDWIDKHNVKLTFWRRGDNPPMQTIALDLSFET
jgi:hypothetical protein